MLKLLGLATGGGWIPLAVAFVLGAALAGAGTWRVMQWHVNEVVAQRDAAVQRADLAEQDAKRWHAASDARDVQITGLTKSLDQQSALVEAGRAKEAQLRSSLDAARAQNDTLQQQADQLSRELDDEVTKAPDDVRPVGPIVRRGAVGLFD